MKLAEAARRVKGSEMPQGKVQNQNIQLLNNRDMVFMFTTCSRRSVEVHMNIALSKHARVTFAQPLYAQVRTHILVRIKAGEWAAGEALPNEFALASEFDVSVGTIRRAIEGLEEQGVLVRKQGRGTYIGGEGRNPLQEKFTALRSLTGAMVSVGYRLEGIVQRSISSLEAEALRCALSTEVVEIQQAVQIDGDEIGVEIAVVSALKFPRLETQLVYGQHLYQLYCQYGVLITQTKDVLVVAPAGAETEKTLPAAAGGHVLTVIRQAFTHDRLPIEYRISHYRADKVSYACTTT